MVSTFRNILLFFDEIGIYDVVLPFILVFTVIFAMLEKTKVLGTEEIEGKTYTRKNLNAMVAFIVGFLVVASAQLVQIITDVSANMVVLLMLVVLFLLLIGSFYGHGEEVKLVGVWRNLFMGIMFIGIIVIFLQAIKRPDGTPWLEWFIYYIRDNFTSTAVGSIILILVLFGAMLYVIKGEPGTTSTPSKEEA